MAGPDRPEGIGFDELADLQAGLLDPAEEQRLRDRLREDPEALETAGLLGGVRDELADLDDEPLPMDVAARLEDTLRTLHAAGPANPEHLDRPGSGPPPSADVDDARLHPPGLRGLGSGPYEAPTPSESGPAAPSSALRGTPGGAGEPQDELAARRSRRRRSTVLGLAAAVAAVAVVGGVVLGPQRAGPVAGNAPTISGDALAGEWPGVTASRDLAFLSDPEVLSACLTSAVGNPNPSAVLGARPVEIEGRSGVLLAVELGAGPPRRIALVVLDPACSLPGAPRGSGVLAQTVITV